MLTILSDIENTINNRPLTYCSAQQDLDVVSPNLFIKNKPNVPNLIFSQDNLNNVLETANNITNFKKVGEFISGRQANNELFIDNYLKQYILDLRSHHKIKYPPKMESHPYLKAGSVCLLKLPRYKTYPLVLIKQVYLNKNNTIRNVRVIKSDHSELVTQITNLVPLELQASNIEQLERPAQTMPIPSDPQPLHPNLNNQSRSSPRRAATRQRDQFRKLITQGLI